MTTSPGESSFTPPPDWDTVDAAAWAREFVEHAHADPRIPLDGGVMTMWFNAAILAGMAHASRPIQFDIDDSQTWPELEAPVMAHYGDHGWVVGQLRNPLGVAFWSVGYPGDASGGVATEAMTGDRWMPVPPAPGGDQ